MTCLNTKFVSSHEKVSLGLMVSSSSPFVTRHHLSSFPQRSFLFRPPLARPQAPVEHSLFRKLAGACANSIQNTIFSTPFWERLYKFWWVWLLLKATKIKQTAGSFLVDAIFAPKKKTHTKKYKTYLKPALGRCILRQSNGMLYMPLWFTRSHLSSQNLPHQ